MSTTTTAERTRGILALTAVNVDIVSVSYTRTISTISTVAISPPSTRETKPRVDTMSYTIGMSGKNSLVSVGINEFVT